MRDFRCSIYNHISANKAVNEFKKEGQSALEFNTWYSPEIVKYLLHSSENNSRCLRYVFFDSHDTRDFVKQIEALKKFSCGLKRPAVFVSKEPGNVNHWISGLIFEDSILIFNPVGITEHNDFYSALGQCGFKKVVLSEAVVQKDANGFVSCGPLVVSWAMLICCTQGPVDSIQAFLRAPDTKCISKAGLSYYPVDIFKFNPKNSVLEAFRACNEYQRYQRIVLNIRRVHLRHLEFPAEKPLTDGMEDYWEACLSPLDQALILDYALSSNESLIGIQDSRYRALAEALAMVKSSSEPPLRLK